MNSKRDLNLRMLLFNRFNYGCEGPNESGGDY